MNISINTNPYTRTRQADKTKTSAVKTDQNTAAARMETGRDKMMISEEARQALAQTLEVSEPAGTGSSDADAIIERLAKYTKVVDEHYQKVNEENKRFENPMQHIQRKYYDRFYPYYVEGLTNMERSICSENEKKVYLGRQPSVNTYDPAIQAVFEELHPGDDERIERHRQYQEERLEILEKEKTVPNHYDLLRWNTVQVIPQGTTKTYDELLMEERILESAMYYHYFLKLNENAGDGQEE